MPLAPALHVEEDFAAHRAPQPLDDLLRAETGDRMAVDRDDAIVRGEPRLACRPLRHLDDAQASFRGVGHPRVDTGRAGAPEASAEGECEGEGEGEPGHWMITPPPSGAGPASGATAGTTMRIVRVSSTFPSPTTRAVRRKTWS